jgi:pimeloyl-ACP methyl ester carboxylesterase
VAEGPQLVSTFQGLEASLFYERFGEGPDVVWISGGGDTGSRWHRHQIPFFRNEFRNTTFDNRGIGKTVCEAAQPWTFEGFARDTAELIEAVCEPPVAIVGLSMGALIVQQLALDRPDLVRCAIAMGTGASSHGWTWDYQKAEMDFRHAGGRLDGMMGVVHYAAMLYPAHVLGDEDLWAKIREDLLEWMGSGENEDSLIAQWDPCLNFDQTARLPGCTVPLHVVAFSEDIQSPPEDGRLVADLAPNAEFHQFERMGHGSIYGHAHDTLNPFIKEIIERYL